MEIPYLKKLNIGNFAVILVIFLKEAPRKIYELIAQHFNTILQSRIIPTSWKKSATLLLFKKGDKSSIDNYRPICLMSQMSKLFSRVILNRINSKLTEGSRREQAGFKRGFSTMDHIHVVTQLIERAQEYQIPLAVLFIDFRKAFDSIEIRAVTSALKRHAILDPYVSLIGELYSNCETNIVLNDVLATIPVERGVKQGDVLSPALFSATLEAALRDCEIPYGINVDGEHLQYLLFADDIVMFAHTPKELETMLNRLNVVTSKIGLKIHPSKTRWMRNDFATPDYDEIKLDDDMLLKTDDYIYLGRSVNMKNSMTTELSRRKGAGWYSFSKLRDIFANKSVSIDVKAHVFPYTCPTINDICLRNMEPHRKGRTILASPPKINGKANHQRANDSTPI